MVYYIETVKCLFSYNFNRKIFKLHTGINYDITHLAFAFVFDDQAILIFGEFLKF